MFDFLYNMSDVNLFVLLSMFSIVISIIGIYLVRRYIPLSVRYKDDSVIGNTGALISVIYGVLAGLTALYLFNNNNYVSDAVLREANAAANTYRDSGWLTSPTQDIIRSNIKKYITVVINKDWPLMEDGEKVITEGNTIIDAISDALKEYKITTSTESLIMQNLLEDVRNLYNARQQRINMSYQQLSPEIWAVILIGTILTLFINFLFGMNFYLHILTVVSAAIMTSSMIFLLITIDRPFQGEFAIDPQAMQSLLTNIENKKI